MRGAVAASEEALDDRARYELKARYSVDDLRVKASVGGARGGRSVRHGLGLSPRDARHTGSDTARWVDLCDDAVDDVV